MKLTFHFWTPLLSILMIVLLSCGANKNAIPDSTDYEQKQIENDTVSIKSDKLEYEIIIIEPGFNAWLYGTAQPEGYYEQEFLESRNRLFINEWNLRVIQPQSYDPNLYVLRIDYDSKIDYGYELNYKLYNYFIFFQLKYKQKLTAFVPRN
ncbi:MAG: DUF6146 family protein [Bacteroidota bacterium]